MSAAFELFRALEKTAALQEFWVSYDQVRQPDVYLPQVVSDLAKWLLIAALRTLDDSLALPASPSQLPLGSRSRPDACLRLKCRQKAKEDSIKLRELDEGEKSDVERHLGHNPATPGADDRPPASIIRDAYGDATVFILGPERKLVYWDAGYPWLADQFYPTKTALLVRHGDLLQHAEATGDRLISGAVRLSRTHRESRPSALLRLAHSVAAETGSQRLEEQLRSH